MLSWRPRSRRSKPAIANGSRPSGASDRPATTSSDGCSRNSACRCSRSSSAHVRGFLPGVFRTHGLKGNARHDRRRHRSSSDLLSGFARVGCSMRQLKQLGAGMWAMAFFASAALASPESEFWAWFKKEEARLFSFESNQDAVFESLGNAMHRVNPDLTFEFGPIEDGKRQFVISAGGISSAFPAVERLYDAAPSLSRWQWVKFRPRRSVISDIDVGG